MLAVENVWVYVCAILPDNRAKLFVHSNRAELFRVLPKWLKDGPTQKGFEVNGFLLTVCELQTNQKLFQRFD